MRTMIVLVLAALPLLAQPGERVEFWHCSGDVYTDRASNGGRLLSIDPSANTIAAETRWPRTLADASGPSVLMIPRPAPHVFEPPSAPHPPLIFGPPTINVRVVR